MLYHCMGMCLIVHAKCILHRAYMYLSLRTMMAFIHTYRKGRISTKNFSSGIVIVQPEIHVSHNTGIANLHIALEAGL